MNDLIGTKEASRILGMATSSTLSRWVQIGKITPVAKLGGRTGGYVFTREQIEAYRDDPTLDARVTAHAS